MAKLYMDYGAIGYQYGNQLPMIEVLKKHYGQPYRLTHTGEGETSPYIDRAYISFTYGGRKILDFGLIATTANDRVLRLSPPSHEDRTTDYKMLHGQFYWGSRYNAREMNLTLATDGMTQRLLDDFKQWFRAGEIRLLIMAEHPNRGIMARVASSPLVSIVPFTRKEWITIDELLEQITVGLYKGTIQLNFVMDDPFWYAINSVFGDVVYNDKGLGILQPAWTNANGELVHLLDVDAQKIIYEDNIPTAGMILNSVILGNNVTLEVDKDKYRKWTVTNERGAWNNNNQTGTPVANNLDDSYSALAGAVTGPIFKMANNNLINLSSINFISHSGVNGWNNDNRGKWYSSASENSAATKDQLAIKKGSFINTKMTASQWPRGLKILIYRYKVLAKDELISSPNYIGDMDSAGNGFQEVYEFTEDCYVRLRILSYTSNLDASSINIESYISAYLMTFEQLQNSSLLTSSDLLAIFYSGTAPSLPEISFEMPLHFNEDGYIDIFNNDYVLTSLNHNYNTLKLVSQTIHELKFTTPSIITAYNKVINYLKDDEKILGLLITTALKMFRNDIGHIGVRNWIIGCINIYKNTYNRALLNNSINQLLVIDNDMRQYLLLVMPYLFKSADLVDCSDLSEPTLQLLQDMPRFISEPEDIFIELDEVGNNDVIFSVNTFNVRGYQWQYSNDTINWNIISDKKNLISGANNNQLIINKKVVEQYVNHYFRCVIWNSLTNNISNYATILTNGIINFNNYTTGILGAGYFKSNSNNYLYIIKNKILKLIINIDATNYNMFIWQYQEKNGNDWIELNKDAYNELKWKKLTLNDSIANKWTLTLPEIRKSWDGYKLRCIISNNETSYTTPEITLHVLYGQAYPEGIINLIEYDVNDTSIEITARALNVNTEKITWYAGENKTVSELTDDHIIVENYTLNFINSLISIDLNGNQLILAKLIITTKEDDNTQEIIQELSGLDKYYFYPYLLGYGSTNTTIYSMTNDSNLIQIIYNDKKPKFIETSSTNIFYILKGESKELGIKVKYATKVELKDGSNNTLTTYTNLVSTDLNTLSYIFDTSNYAINTVIGLSLYGENTDDNTEHNELVWTIIIIPSLTIELNNQVPNNAIIYFDLNKSIQDSINLIWDINCNIESYLCQYTIILIDDKNNEKTLVLKTSLNSDSSSISYTYAANQSFVGKYILIKCLVSQTISINNTNFSYINEKNNTYELGIGSYSLTAAPLSFPAQWPSINYTATGFDTSNNTVYTISAKYVNTDHNISITTHNNKICAKPPTSPLKFNNIFTFNYSLDKTYSLTYSYLGLTDNTKLPGGYASGKLAWKDATLQLLKVINEAKIKFTCYDSLNHDIASKLYSLSNETTQVFLDQNFFGNALKQAQTKKIQLSLLSLILNCNIYDAFRNSDWIYLDGFKIPCFIQVSTQTNPSKANNAVSNNSNNNILPKNIINTNNNNNNNNKNLLFNFNNSIGEFICTYRYNTILHPTAILDDITDIREIARMTSIIKNEYKLEIANVGDMILNNNLIFDNQNIIEPSIGKIVPWSLLHPTSCYKLEYDGLIPLRNFQINYKILYL